MQADDIIREARSWIGTPFVPQAALKGVGGDCIAPLRGVWRELIGPEPPIPAYPRRGDGKVLLAMLDRHFRKAWAPEPGLVAVIRWKGLFHCAILAHDTLIHCRSLNGVREEPLTPALYRVMTGFYRFPLPEG